MATALERFTEVAKKVVQENDSIFNSLERDASPYAIRQVLYSMMNRNFKVYQDSIAYEILTEKCKPTQNGWNFESALKKHKSNKALIEAQIKESFGLTGYLNADQIRAVGIKAIKNNDRDFMKVCLETASQMMTRETKQIFRHY